MLSGHTYPPESVPHLVVALAHLAVETVEVSVNDDATVYSSVAAKHLSPPKCVRAVYGQYTFKQQSRAELNRPPLSHRKWLFIFWYLLY